MSINIADISAKLRAYLLTKAEVTDLVGQRIFTPSFPVNTVDSIDNEANPKIQFKQTGGSPKGTANYRYQFIVRADTAIVARQIAVSVVNQIIEENFSLSDDDGKNLTYWAELEGSLVDNPDENTSKPEVFFSINFNNL